MAGFSSPKAGFSSSKAVLADRKSVWSRRTEARLASRPVLPILTPQVAVGPLDFFGLASLFRAGRRITLPGAASRSPPPE
jgi:hypothetical protein